MEKRYKLQWVESKQREQTRKREKAVFTRVQGRGWMSDKLERDWGTRQEEKNKNRGRKCG